MTFGISRRKFVAISAAAGGLSLLPSGMPTRAATADLVEWNGVMLGGLASLRLYHPDRLAGERILGQAIAEARRLEEIFSLYRPESPLCELNRSGVLVAPPQELVDLLGLCDRFWHETDGAFDVTVQPLWQCYVEHFSRDGASQSGPSAETLETAVRLVGWSHVRVSSERIALARPGMGLTLNGVAQGYITDRVVSLLREAGVTSSLVDMGEIRALGPRPDGRPWQAALADAPGHAVGLVDKAVATSAADGFRFDADGRCNHLFHPATGRCADPATSLTVVAPTAAAADALSTAFALMDRETAARTLAAMPDTQLYVNAGQTLRDTPR